MSFADVSIIEEYEDCSEDSTESHLEISTSEIRVVIEGTVESLKSLNDDDDVNDPEDEGTDMTLKQNENETDHFGVEDIQMNPDDLLPPLAKLEKYATSDMIFNRQVVARNLLETLRVVHENQDEVSRVIDVLYTISEDFEPSVRSELMEQFPHIAAFCKENPSTLGNIIPKYLVPILLNYLGVENNQVRKTCYSTLLTLVKRNLIDVDNLNERICPLIIDTTDKTQLEEHRTEAVTLISKLAVQLGKEITEKLFLDRFCSLCLDESFHVRKACADSFGDFCGIVGKEITEEKLLSKFFCLCKDPIWGVRKACAEVFMPISCICSMDIRHKELANVFISLLCDQSRWVRMASFQTLGPFISTFAKPDKTGLYYTKDGVLTIVDIPYSPLEQSEMPVEDSHCKDSEDISSSNITSESATFYSSLDRTISSNSCDNVVPLCSTENTLSTSEVPSISCHSGNFCTVIEVGSDATVPNEEKESSDKVIYDSSTDTKHPPSVFENGLEYGIQNSTVEDMYFDFVNSTDVYEGDIDSRAFKKLWYEAMYGVPERSLVNGDIHNELNDDYDNDRLIENHIDADSSDTTYNTCEYESAILSTVTVNGVNVSSSVALGGPLNCQALPVVSYNAIVKGSKNDVEDSDESNCKVTEVDTLEPDAPSSEVHHSTESTCTDEQSELSVEEEVSDVDLCSHVIQQETSNDESIPKTKIEVTSLELELNQPVDDESAFNHFQYWRTPLPEVDISDLNKESNTASKYGMTSRRQIQFQEPGWFNQTSAQTVSTNSSSTSNLGNVKDSLLECGILMNEENIKSGKDPYLSMLEGEPPPNSFTMQLYSVHDQDIVPPQLLLRYLSMTDVSRAQTVDTDIARHCAYSLPAVALTLGRKFWPCLRETYNTLASDMQGFIMQWKVRRTLASSMHQIAVILGPDITARDLVPIFSGFIKDLDEVRIGILQHISEFLKVLRIEERRLFLPQLSEFLNTDNERNWRFRLVLAEQMIPIADLYNPEDVRDHLVPLSLALVWDKISEVRLAAVRVMAVMMRRMSESPTQTLTKGVLTDLAEKFIHAPKWLHRQIYVYLCQEFITENSLPPDQFAEDAMPHLLYLCWDRVPNVRVAIARCLAAVIWPLDTFSNPDSPHRELLLQAIHTLQSDVDADVRYYANMVSTHECSCLQHGELNDLTSESFI